MTPPKSTQTTQNLVDVDVSNPTHKSADAEADALFLSIGDGAIATDQHGRITRVNQIALDLLGFTRREIIGAWYPKTIVAVNENNEPLDIADRPISRAIVTGQPVSAKTFYRRKDGSPLPIALTVAPFTVNGRPVGAVQVFRDYTTELEIDRAKDEFISIASHQLRTPLTIIRTYAEMLASGFGGELNTQQAAYVDAVNVSIVRMATLINSLLSVARIESGQVHITRKSTDVACLLNDVTTEMQPQLKGKDVRLQVKTEELPTIFTDQILLKEIFVNLLSNAIKYTPARGTIKITLGHRAKRLNFMISDSGYGIPKAEQEKVFSKFYRGSNILKRDTDGTGIGLYLVKRIVETLEGNIWFESKEHKGTTFHLDLPIASK